MKKAWQIILLLALVPGFSNAVVLLAKENPQCLALAQSMLASPCNDEGDFYFDQNGNCGCLYEEAITSASMCTNISPSCENEDQVFSHLYRYREINGLIEIAAAGCGCFTVEKSMSEVPAVDLSIPKLVKKVVNVPCSTSALVSAINAANTAGSGVLRLASNCTYVIIAPATANDGLPVITGDISLIGGPSTRITRNNLAPAFRIMNVNAGAKLKVQGIFIENGNTPGLGGAFLNNGILTLERVTCAHNEASNGGAIANIAGANLTILGSLISTNNASSVGGGGLINFSQALINKSIFRHNTAPINGGSINTQPSGTTTSVQSTIASSTSGSLGGGLSNLGTSNITRTLINDNSGSGGGGIATGNANVTLTISEVRHNSPDNCSPLNTIPNCLN